MRTPKPFIEEIELRRGPWTLEEDNLLTHYISLHGEGRWNMLAKCAGLKRTGKSCRLRWLNYLKPDIKRGNLTPQEQLLILELHSKWGNRWSKIAQHLPGRTDNEIKNYWRTRVQKQARQLNIESNSKGFIDAVRCYWMPSLLQKMDQTSFSPSLTTMNISKNTDYSPDSVSVLSPTPSPTVPSLVTSCTTENSSSVTNPSVVPMDSLPINTLPEIPETPDFIPVCGDNNVYNNLILCDSYCGDGSYDMEGFNFALMQENFNTYEKFPLACHVTDNNWAFDDMADHTLWNMDDIWQFREEGGKGIYNVTN